MLRVALRCVEPSADSRAAQRQFAQVWQSRTHMGFTVLELRRVAGEFLAKRQRCRVLQMGAADLHDVHEVGRLLLQRAAQFGDGRQQLVGERLDRGHVHGGREHVVARLTAVDVVVRMHQTALPALATEQLARAIRQHLVHVHVGLRAGAGLPDHQRKLVRVHAGDDLICRGNDGLHLLFVLQAECLVHHRRRPLDLRQRSDDFARLALARDVEVLQRALRLRAPELVGRDRDRAEGVAFNACDHGKRPGPAVTRQAGSMGHAGRISTDRGFDAERARATVHRGSLCRKSQVGDRKATANALPSCCLIYSTAR